MNVVAFVPMASTKDETFFLFGNREKRMNSAPESL
jgi:hypothetical protein